ncbi:MAG: hypothetical protein U0744_08570 [Gemmataceae bacterium]
MTLPLIRPDDDDEHRLAHLRLKELAEELTQQSPELAVVAQQDESGMPHLEVSLGDRPIAEVHLVADSLEDPAVRLYGIIGDFEEVTAEDYAGTRSEIITRLLEIAAIDSE